jgi:hypothetical protein
LTLAILELLKQVILTWEVPSHKLCNPSGLGNGSGGHQGAARKNCKPLGNVLIIQEANDDMSIPDDNQSGGTIFWTLSHKLQLSTRLDSLTC